LLFPSHVPEISGGKQLRLKDLKFRYWSPEISDKERVS